MASVSPQPQPLFNVHVIAVSEEPKAGPVEVLRIWVEAFNVRDLNRICGLYANDAVLWGTFSPSLISSPRGVREYFAHAFDPSMQASAELQEYRLQALGPVAVLSGAYLLRARIAGQSRSLPARFTVVLGQSHGLWKIVSHHSSLTPS
jgi:ketosteroid isomerase-like protein